jgi:lipopolysaccharide transport system ATP-binding protein
MGELAIRVAGLGKQYRLGAAGARAPYQTVREAVARVVRRPFRRAAGGGELFWALRDVSFDVTQGEVVGVIGRNGAGKSTLLKLLSRITEPTEGEADIYGRVGSLLEVGTGFHPELTGRENVFLNGAILGMARSEIARKFAEIVAFAEVEKFIDTPVKFYSSGMYMRLAFAVAAHLEPEILIVDEVLAVGDAQFQKKCLDKMSEVGAGGRTVLFVSHNMPAVTRLCGRALLLADGRVTADGDPVTVTGHYLHTGEVMPSKRAWADLTAAPGDDVVRLRGVRAVGGNGADQYEFSLFEPVTVEIDYEVLSGGSQLSPVVRVTNGEGVIVFTAIDADAKWGKDPRPAGRYRTTATIPGRLLNEGVYSVLLTVTTYNPTTIRMRVPDAICFTVTEARERDPVRDRFGGELRGVTRPPLSWSTAGPL